MRFEIDYGEILNYKAIKFLYKPILGLTTKYGMIFLNKILNNLLKMNLTNFTNSSESDNGDIFFIHKTKSQDFEIRQGLNWLIYVSYSCFLVSTNFNITIRSHYS